MSNRPDREHAWRVTVIADDADSLSVALAHALERMHWTRLGIEHETVAPTWRVKVKRRQARTDDG